MLRKSKCPLMHAGPAHVELPALHQQTDFDPGPFCYLALLYACIFTLNNVLLYRLAEDLLSICANTPPDNQNEPATISSSAEVQTCKVCSKNGAEG